jgi:hypothetical protein
MPVGVILCLRCIFRRIPAHHDMALPRVEDSREGFRIRGGWLAVNKPKKLLTGVHKKNSPCILNCREGHQNPFGLEENRFRMGAF